MVTMAKVKSKGGRPPVPEPKKAITSFRGSTAFAEWFEAFVKRERVSGASLIENALVHYAKQRGYEPEAPER